MATCSSDHSVKVFDIDKNGEYVQSGELLGHEAAVWQVSWAHPQFGSLLATCGYDRRVMVFREAAQGSWVRVYCYEGHESSGGRRGMGLQCVCVCVPLSSVLTLPSSPLFPPPLPSLHLQ